jgi:hypothetical protein
MIEQPLKELPIRRLPLDNTQYHLESSMLTPEVDDRIQPEKVVELVPDLTNTALKGSGVQVDTVLTNK